MNETRFGARGSDNPLDRILTDSVNAADITGDAETQPVEGIAVNGRSDMDSTYLRGRNDSKAQLKVMEHATDRRWLIRDPLGRDLLARLEWSPGASERHPIELVPDFLEHVLQGMRAAAHPLTPTARLAQTRPLCPDHNRVCGKCTLAAFLHESHLGDDQSPASGNETARSRRAARRALVALGEGPGAPTRIYGRVGAEEWAAFRTAWADAIDELGVDGVDSQLAIWVHNLLQVPTVRTPSNMFEYIVHTILDGKAIPPRSILETRHDGFRIHGLRLHGRSIAIRHDVKRALTWLVDAQTPVDPLQDHEFEIALQNNALQWVDKRSSTMYALRVEDAALPLLQGYVQRQQLIQSRMTEAASLMRTGSDVVRGSIALVTDDLPAKREMLVRVAAAAGIETLVPFKYIEDAIAHRIGLPSTSSIMWLTDLGGTARGNVHILGVTSMGSPDQTFPWPTLDLEAAVRARWPQDILVQATRLFNTDTTVFARDHNVHHVAFREFVPDVLVAQLRALARGESEVDATTRLAHRVVSLHERMIGRGSTPPASGGKAA